MSITIASWNINSVRARLSLVEQFCRLHQPDILCLQETKVDNGSFPHEALRQLGYPHIARHGQRMHHGVAILSRLPMVEEASFDWQANGEARHLGVRLPGGLRLENVYVPAGGDIPDPALNPKFAQKLAFVERMMLWSAALAQPTLLVGDFNIAPFPEDVWSHQALLNVVSHTPVEVELLMRLQASHDWVDLGRVHTPRPAKLYTWWSYRASDWRASDRGRRLDHMWASPALAPRVLGCRTIVDARGWEKPSDHAPLIVEIDV